MGYGNDRLHKGELYPKGGGGYEWYEGDTLQ